MKETTKAILKELSIRDPSLSCVEQDVQAAYEIIRQAFANGNTLYLCGNGGKHCGSQRAGLFGADHPDGHIQYIGTGLHHK